MLHVFANLATLTLLVAAFGVVAFMLLDRRDAIFSALNAGPASEPLRLQGRPARVRWSHVRSQVVRGSAVRSAA